MILRILNPPHTGAQSEIGSEPLTIGSSMDCDLILNDPLLQPEHCKIRKTPDGIEVELTGGAAHLDGKPVESSPFIVHAGQVLSIGSTHMAFGEPDAVWSAIAIPSLESLGGVAPEPEEAEPTDSPQENPAARNELPSQGGAQRVKIGIAAFVILFALLLLGFYFYSADQKRAMKSVARTNGNTTDFFTVNMYETNVDNQAAEKVSEQIKRAVSGATIMSGERSGKAYIRVYVRNRSQVNEVQKIVNASPVPVFSEIVSLEEIEKSAEMMASMKGYAIDVTFTKDGTAYWTGYMPRLDDWNEVKKSLEIDLPYIKENINNLTFAADIEKRANQLAAEAGIKSPLVLKSGTRDISLSSTIPENQMELWNQVYSKLRDQFGGIVTISDKVGSGKAVVVSENPFHSPIAGVSLGAIPSVILVDGQRIYIGAVLKDGSVLESITDSSLTLSGPKGARSIPIQSSALSENASLK